VPLPRRFAVEGILIPRVSHVAFPFTHSHHHFGWCDDPDRAHTIPGKSQDYSMISKLIEQEANGIGRRIP
jgi:hypothetical protein